MTCRGLRKGWGVVSGAYVYYDYDAGDGVHAFNSNHLTGPGDHTPKLQTGSGSVIIYHNEDGTRTFDAGSGMTGWDGGPTLVSSGGSSWALPTIPRLTSAPSMPIITELAQTRLRASFTDGSGGAAIDSRQLRYGTDSSGSGATIISSDGSDIISSLIPGTTYYIWARTHNSVGYSDWSARATATTYSGAWVNDGGIWKRAIPYVKESGVWKTARPWVRILGEWKETS